ALSDAARFMTDSWAHPAQDPMAVRLGLVGGGHTVAPLEAPVVPDGLVKQGIEALSERVVRPDSLSV
ncbi:MAG: hypothetical protein NT062_01085, partial [Proteobacteria bacterium]|nr:hypothetical protein [Pseudomonadota bacterium]